jgi:hypothetical protein
MSVPPMTAEQHSAVMHKRRERRRMVDAARELKQRPKRMPGSRILFNRSPCTLEQRINQSPPVGNLPPGAPSFTDSTGASRPQSSQSSPNVSTGCCVRSAPFPQAIESAGQYLSQPQQMRSGLLGWMGNFLAIACYLLRNRNVQATYPRKLTGLLQLLLQLEFSVASASNISQHDIFPSKNQFTWLSNNDHIFEYLMLPFRAPMRHSFFRGT